MSPLSTTRAHRPAHIAMFSIPAHGHVNPSLEVIRELVARGHRVTYAIPPSFAEIVAATGAEPKFWNSTLPTDEDPALWGTELLDAMDLFLDDAIQALPQLAAAYEGDEPDLVLHDTTAYPAQVLAHRWGVPAVQLAPHMVVWDGFQADMGEQMSVDMRGTERGRAYFERFSAWLDEQGMSEVTDPERIATEPACGLALIPRAMQPHADRVDHARFTFVGACQGDRGHQGDWRRPDGLAADTKVLLVSLGSSYTNEPGFYRECIEAFGGLPGWHVVLQVGKHIEISELGAIPDNFEVHHWVPQLAVLRQADAFITHAGMGGSQEGLANGVPMVCVPQAVDQFMNADILQGLGVARYIPKAEATADVLREAVLSLVNDSQVAAVSERIRREVAAEGGAKRAADLIEAKLPQG
ncbi:glycosyl transferase [Streptomyces griseoflavus]|uniref:macrolide family glycosyltransferase n=1 Tax=Streptomyces rimosus TaxID=1927 RepID=UPI00067D65E4|nr:macrolide family glycosyltransferase [Streptomyces rimosus]KOG54234.1 glycosyl transferase [Streptomyces griseoflavus]